jgi:cytochrome c553
MAQIKRSITVLLALGLNAVALAGVSTVQLEQEARDALRLTADTVNGKALYEQRCGGCHGPEAHGDVIRLIPALAGQRRAYLIKHVAELNDAERAAAHMHPTLDSVDLATPQAWADLAEYLRQRPLLRVPASVNAPMAELGERSYRRWCASCHGTDALGNETRFAPALKHQHREYLLKEIRMVSAPHRMSLGSDVMRVLDSLNTQATAGIADYISRIPEKPPRQ